MFVYMLLLIIFDDIYFFSLLQTFKMELTKAKNFIIENPYDALDCALNNENAKGLKLFSSKTFIEPQIIFEYLDGKIKPKVKRLTTFKSDTEAIVWLLKNAVSRKNEFRVNLEKVFFDFERLKYIGTDAMVICGFEPMNTIHEAHNLLFSFDVFEDLSFEIEPPKYYPNWFQCLPDYDGEIDFCIDENIYGILCEFLRIAKVFETAPYVTIYKTVFNAIYLVRAVEFLVRAGGEFPFLFNQRSPSHCALCLITTPNIFALVMPMTINSDSPTYQII